MELDQHPQDYAGRLHQALTGLDFQEITKIITKLEAMRGTDRTLFIAGNGGSSATASHAACDFSKTILGKDTKNQTRWLRTVCFNDNIPLMTAWANDLGYEHIFSEQIRNLGKKGDLFLALTCSGNSPNIIKAVAAAKERGMESYGFLGFDGGKVKDLLDGYLLVPSYDYGVVEDVHIILCHMITDWFRQSAE